MRVLFVDDEEGLLDQAEVFLQKMEYDFNVETVRSAEDALEQLNQREYDGIVSDYQMPITDGLEFLKILREERNNDLPFIMFTGKGREEVAISALNLGADRYIQKGGSPKSQYGILAEALNQEVKRHEIEKKLELTQYSVDKASASIYWIRPDGSFVYTNDKVKERLGYTSEELKDMSVWDVDPEHNKDIREDRWKKLKKEKVLKFRSKHQTKEGRFFPVEITSHYIEHEGEEYEFAFSRDISDRDGTREEFEKSEKKKFQEIFNNANDAMYLHELTEEGMPGDFIEVNDVACDMLGYSREELMNMSPKVIDATEKREDVPDIMGELIEKGDLRFEMIHETKDGTKIPVEIHSHVFEYEGEDRVLSVARDISERKEAERELKKSEKRFRKSFEALPDPAFLLEEDGIFRDINEAAVMILGYGKKEIIDKHISETPFITELDREKAVNVFKKRQRGEDVSPYELELVSKDGKTIYSEINAGSFEDDGFQGEIVIARDITEEKLSEKKLKDTQQRLELALEGAELGVWDWNIKDGEAKFNERWAEIIGYNLDEVDQTVDFWEERVHPEDRQKVHEKLDKHLDGETDIYKSEHRMETKSGDWRWIKDVGKIFERDEEGNPVRAVGVHEDITKRKSTEKKLKESEKKYKELSKELENILDHLPGLVYYKDKENNLIRVNKALAEAHGMTKEEMEGKSLFDLYPENQARKYWEDDQEVIENREPKLNMVEPWSPDEERWLSTSKIPYIVDGEVKGIIGISIDITEEKKTQEREELLHTILRHDIKNKIQVVHGYLQLMDEQDLSEETKDFLKKAIKGNKESMNLLSKIRLLLRAQEEVKKGVNIASTVNDAVDETKSLAHDEGMEISIMCPSMECEVEGGPLLKEVFSNIIENSIHHSEGGIIKITGEIKEEEVVCTIEDDGKGIPDEKKDTIFKKGYTTDKKRGTGLGLFLVKMLLDTYEGKIDVDDSEHGGARFDIHLKRCLDG